MTTPSWFIGLLDVAIIGLGMVAGFFATFSDFLMRSLALSRPGSGIEVMQVINREVLRSATIVLLWGMLALCLVLTGAASVAHVAGAPFLLIAGGLALYVAGVLVVSVARNLPMNDRLASMESSSLEATTYWQDAYVERWVRWNTVRAIASAGAALCLLLANGWLTRGGA